MPRRERIKSESNIYHVMARGNERKSLFIDDEDRQRFVDTMRRLIEKTANDKKEKKFKIYAYCLMDNHVHLLINQEEDTVSRIMKRIGTSYAYYFNKKYARIGHLFQDRFRSEPVEDDGYLLAAVRYIHNNPVKAGLTADACQYKWSSYSEYIDEDKTKRFVDTETVLGIFSDNRLKAKELFEKFSQEKNEDIFIEYSESNKEKELNSRKEIESYIEKYLSDNMLERAEINDPVNRTKRNKLISELKSKSNLSIREMAKLLEVDRGVVQRIK